ncbi:MAG: cysteine--tRNA ligase [Aquihabitans sp.]
MLVTLGRERIALLGRARVYVCGITPYDTTHIGHAATAVWSDVAIRFLRSLGQHVEVTRNVTDVDDALMAASTRTGTHWRSLASQQTFRFADDMARLGISTPTNEPLAHNFIDEVIALAAGLVDLGHAYVAGGSVYFDHHGVAERAGLTYDQALALAAERGGGLDDPAKRDPLDAALWVRSTGDQPAWDSPWGPGRPGWHAECSAMALATLGPGLDLHCGGADLMFPHHAFEAAQAEAATGVTPFARAWLRAGMVTHGGEKMAKSTGNLVFVDDVLKSHSPAALRLLISSRRWWDTWEFDAADLPAAEARVVALRHAAARTNPNDDNARDAVVAALADDLDIPLALALAEDAGGRTAELLVDVLGLRHIEPVTRSRLLPTP